MLLHQNLLDFDSSNQICYMISTIGIQTYLTTNESQWASIFPLRVFNKVFPDIDTVLRAFWIWILRGKAVRSRKDS